MSSTPRHPHDAVPIASCTPLEGNTQIGVRRDTVITPTTDLDDREVSP